MTAPEYRKPGFAAGMRWLTAAADLMSSQFSAFAGVAALWLLVSMIAVIPLIGQLIVVLLTPVLTAGAIAAFSRAEEGHRPAPTMLFAAFGRPDLRNRLFMLAAFSLIGSVIVLMVLAAWLGGQVTPDLIQSAQQSPEAMAELIEQVDLGPMLLLALALFAVILAALYFAIPLVVYHEISALAALTKSLRSVFANWAAFLGFGLAVVILVFALGLVFGIVSLGLGLAMGTTGPMIAQVVFMLMAMLVQVLMAGCQWIAFRQVFGRPGGDPESASDDQLLA